VVFIHLYATANFPLAVCIRHYRSSLGMQRVVNDVLRYASLPHVLWLEVYGDVRVPLRYFPYGLVDLLLPIEDLINMHRDGCKVCEDALKPYRD